MCFAVVGTRGICREDSTMYRNMPRMWGYNVKRRVGATPSLWGNDYGICVWEADRERGERKETNTKGGGKISGED